MSQSTQSAAEKGIVILGCPRSGTTLLQRLLDAHPRISCPPETQLFRACGRFLLNEPTAPGVALGVLSGLDFIGFPADEVRARLREFAFGIERDIAHRRNKPRWAEKTAYDVFYLDALEPMLTGHCQFICLFRHGLDVTCSLQELCQTMDLHPEEFHPYVIRYARPLQAYAQLWVDVCQRLLKFTEDHRDEALVVVYDRLVEDPRAELVRIFEFLGEPSDIDEILTRAFRKEDEPIGLSDWKTFGRARVTTESKGRWSKLPTGALAYLAPMVNPTLARLGLPEVDVPVPSERHLRRRWAMNARVSKMKALREGGD